MPISLSERPRSVKRDKEITYEYVKLVVGMFWGTYRLELASWVLSYSDVADAWYHRFCFPKLVAMVVNLTHGLDALYHSNLK